MNTRPHVAVLGLGAMGYAFARNLLIKGFTVYGWNRSVGRGKELVAFGMNSCNTAEEAVEHADVVISMLSDGDVTQDIMSRIQYSLPMKSIFCQMATIGVSATENLIKSLHLNRPDVVFIDAPVSGTKTPAENAQIIVLASGDRDRANVIEPVFDAISKNVIWYGQAGQSQKMKLVLNTWLVFVMQGVAESLQLASNFGFTTNQLWEALDGGPLAAPYVKAKLSMLEQPQSEPQMQLKLALKDANLALNNLNPELMPGLATISNVWTKAEAAGYGSDDLSSIYLFLKERSSGSMQKELED